jgi:flagellar hook-associated protein 3 FlgL
MRVTSNSFPIDLRNSLGDLATKQAELQRQAASGQRIVNPSDDPRAVRKTLDLQNELRSLNQYRNNTNKLREILDAGYTSISGLKRLSDRANEVATLADVTRGAEGLTAYAAEINQLLEQAVTLANTKHHTGYLFGGTKNTAAPISTTRDAAGRITGVAYNGTSTVAASDVADGIALSVNFPGENTGAGQSGVLKNGSGADFLNHLIALRNHLETASAGGAAGTTAINDLKATDAANLQKDENNFIDLFGRIGALQSSLDTSKSISQKRAESIDPLISAETDADLADTLVRLNQIQNAYTAALKSGGSILNTSLLDYLR